jgi:hypothetical protein
MAGICSTSTITGMDTLLLRFFDGFRIFTQEHETVATAALMPAFPRVESAAPRAPLTRN